MSVRIVDEHPHGFGWVHSGEVMERAAHALVHEGRVWLVDPTDAPEPLARAEAAGEIAGVVQLLDRHPRANRALSRRYGVPLHRLPRGLSGTPFQLRTVLDVPGWREVALWWPGPKVLVIAETVGSAPYFAVGAGPLGVHPMLRAWPPGRGLVDLRPEHVLLGHGAGVHERAADALAVAFRRTRRDLPRLLTAAPALARAGRQLARG